MQVQAYIRAYARHFSIYEHIKLQCKLVQLRRHDGGGWTVLYHDLRLDKFFQVREPPSCDPPPCTELSASLLF